MCNNGSFALSRISSNIAWSFFPSCQLPEFIFHLYLIDFHNITCTRTLLPDQRLSSCVHLWATVLLWAVSWSALKEISNRWTWDMLAGRKSPFQYRRSGFHVLLLAACLKKRSICMFPCRWTSMYVLSPSVLWVLERSFAATPTITVSDWLFDCFQGIPAKPLFCDYHLICSPVHLYGTITRFHILFDWQLVNDVISILFGKWNCGNNWLVHKEQQPFVTY